MFAVKVAVVAGQDEDGVVELADLFQGLEDFADAFVNRDRNLKLQYLAGRGLNVLAADEIFAGLAGSGPSLPRGLFTGTPAELEQLEQRLAGRRNRY